MSDLEASVSRELAPIQAEHTEALSILRELSINGPADLDFATDLVKDVKAKHKAIEARRTEITKPLLAAKRSVDDLFRPVLDTLVESERILKGKIGAYALAQETARREVMQASAATYLAGGTPTEPIPEPAQAAGVSVSHYWDFEITDPDLVPRDLCSPDPAKIKARIWYANTPSQPPRDIPGIRFVPAQRVAVRA